MANEESPIVQDIFFNSTAMILENNEDIPFPTDLVDIDISTDFDSWSSPFDIVSWTDYFDGEETMSIDQFFSNSRFDIPSLTSQQQQIVPNDSSLTNQNYQPDISLSFINAPEPFYHVRYLSEITDSPLNGNVVNTRIKTKKNTSGRYLKGIHSRYVTIQLPLIPSDYSNLFIRVTRLTVPYQDISFIHPYPLLYSDPKKKLPSIVIPYGVSLYFPINKQEICSCSKHFPNIILIRGKQSDLKQMNNLYSFDNSDISHPFMGNNVKNKIALYQLKKSVLDFRLVIRSEQTEQFFDTDIFCRSNELIEEEGLEWKKSST